MEVLHSTLILWPEIVWRRGVSLKENLGWVSHHFSSLSQTFSDSRRLEFLGSYHGLLTNGSWHIDDLLGFLNPVAQILPTNTIFLVLNKLSLFGSLLLNFILLILTSICQVCSCFHIFLWFFFLSGLLLLSLPNHAILYFILSVDLP